MNGMIRFLLALALVLLIPTTVFGATEELKEETYREYLNAYDLSFFEETLGEDVYSYLQEFGIEDFSFESLSGLSPDQFTEILLRMIKGNMKEPTEGLLLIIFYIIVSSLLQSLKNDDTSLGDTYSTVSALLISTLLAAKVSPVIALCTSAISICSDFIYAFVPVFCAIVAASGGITASFSTNAMLLMLSQGLAFLSSNVFMPLINCFLAVGICSSLNADLHLDRLSSSMNKVITTVISFIAGAFVSVLSIKTTISAKADYLGLRSVRFVINSVVPVVGSAISEGLLSIQSYSSLMKSSVGTVGIIAVSLVFLPSLIETMIWRLMIGVGQIVSDVFHDKSVSLTLKTFKTAMLLMNVVLVVSMMTTIISIGLLVAARTS